MTIEERMRSLLENCQYIEPPLTQSELDDVCSQIMSLIPKAPKLHKSPDNYRALEKYTDCEHKKEDAIGGNCQACDTAWLIERCRYLERYIDAIPKVPAMLTRERLIELLPKKRKDVKPFNGNYEYNKAIDDSIFALIGKVARPDKVGEQKGEK